MRIILPIFSLLILTTCGYKGPLYFPDSPSPAKPVNISNQKTDHTTAPTLRETKI